VSQDSVQGAQGKVSAGRKARRAIPTREGTWRRGGHLVRVRLIDIEPALPEVAYPVHPSLKMNVTPDDLRQLGR